MKNTSLLFAASKSIRNADDYAKVSIGPNGLKDNGFKAQDHERKADAFYSAFIITREGELQTVGSLKIYNTSSSSYASVSLSGWNSEEADDVRTGGYEKTYRATGKAGGFGYHRPSAAVSDALNKMGFTSRFGGAGESIMKEGFLNAISALLGIGTEFIYLKESRLF